MPWLDFGPPVTQSNAIDTFTTGAFCTSCIFPSHASYKHWPSPALWDSSLQFLTWYCITLQRCLREKFHSPNCVSLKFLPLLGLSCCIKVSLWQEKPGLMAILSKTWMKCFRKSCSSFEGSLFFPLQVYLQMNSCDYPFRCVCMCVQHCLWFT